MKLIVGLGNPGEKYKNTRHNVGFMVIDELAKAMNTADWKTAKKINSELSERKPLAILAKPQTFMNNSGVAVGKLVNYYKIYVPDTIVIHDDLDLRLGSFKIQKGHGPRLHYGVNSIEQKLKSENFWRVRIGVDSRSPNNRIAGEDYVLQNFADEEKTVIVNLTSEIIDNVITDFLGGPNNN